LDHRAKFHVDLLHRNWDVSPRTKDRHRQQSKLNISHTTVSVWRVKMTVENTKQNYLISI